MQVYDIIQLLREDTSTNNKLKILQANVDNSKFGKVLQLTYSPLLTYNIKELPEVNNHSNVLSLGELLTKVLPNLYTKKVTGKSAYYLVEKTLGNLSLENAEIFRLILGRDLKSGIGVKSINKAFGKNFVPKCPYMGAVPYDAKKLDKLFKANSVVYAEVKMDGRYANMTILNGKVSIESRQGKPNNLGGIFDSLGEVLQDDRVLNGELIMPNFSRYHSNGIIASINSIETKIITKGAVAASNDIEKLEKKYNKSYDELLKGIQFIVWDTITFKEYCAMASNKPRNERIIDLMALPIFKLGNVFPIQIFTCKSKQEIMDIFKLMLKKGEEGLIVKSYDGTWKDGKPVYQIKLKLEFTCELKTIGFKKGKKGTKYENTLGSLICTSADGLVNADPSGFSEEEREEIYNNQDHYMNGIVQVKCNALSQDEKGNYSLMHPVFEEHRSDKTKANTLPEIKEIENAILGVNNDKTNI